HRRESSFLCRGDHLRAQVHAEDCSAPPGNFFGKGSVPTAEVQNPLARSWVEEVYYGKSMPCDERSSVHVLVRVPLLTHAYDSTATRTGCPIACRKFRRRGPRTCTPSFL